MKSVSLKKVIALGKNISSCVSRKDWEKSIDGALRDVGAQYYLITLGSYEPKSALPEYAFSTFPKAWMDFYRSSLLIRKDPIRRYSQAHFLPIIWSKFRDNGDPAFWKMREDFGLREGITLPMKGATRIGSVSVAIEDACCHDEQVAILNTLNPYIAEKVFAEEKSAPQKVYRLTARESEVLHWLAEGKRSSEIAIILDCAERTINFHVTNIVKKMNASSRQHAVAKAVNAGLVSPKAC